MVKSFSFLPLFFLNVFLFYVFAAWQMLFCTTILFHSPSFLLAFKLPPWLTGNKKCDSASIRKKIGCGCEREREKKGSNNVTDNTGARLRVVEDISSVNGGRAEASRAEPHARCATSRTGAE